MGWEFGEIPVGTFHGPTENGTTMAKPNRAKRDNSGYFELPPGTPVTRANIDRYRRKKREAKRPKAQRTKYAGIWYYPGRLKCYRAWVDRDGFKSFSKGFTELDAAYEWQLREVSSIINKGKRADSNEAKKALVKDIVKSYILEEVMSELTNAQCREIADSKYYNINALLLDSDQITTSIYEDEDEDDDGENERERFVTELRVIDVSLRHPMCEMKLLDITKQDGKNYVRWRKPQVFKGPGDLWSEEKWKTPKGSTIQKEVKTFSRIFNHAIDMYPHDGIINPFEKLSKSSFGKMHGRKPRSLEPGELELLLDACKGCLRLNRVYMPLIIFMAVQTGMRLGEIFRLKRQDINKEGCYIQITRSKTDDKQGEPGRKVPLTYSVEKTIDFLERIVGGISPEKELFGKFNSSALQAVWRDVKRRAKENAPEGALKTKMTEHPPRFHDLRHTAISLISKTIDGCTDCKDCWAYIAWIDV